MRKEGITMVNLSSDEMDACTAILLMYLFFLFPGLPSDHAKEYVSWDDGVYQYEIDYPCFGLNDTFAGTLFLLLLLLLSQFFFSSETGCEIVFEVPLEGGDPKLDIVVKRISYITDCKFQKMKLLIPVFCVALLIRCAQRCVTKENEVPPT